MSYARGTFLGPATVVVIPFSKKVHGGVALQQRQTLWGSIVPLCKIPGKLAWVIPHINVVIEFTIIAPTQKTQTQHTIRKLMGNKINVPAIFNVF